MANVLSSHVPVVRHVQVTARLSHFQEFGRGARMYYGDRRHDLPMRRKSNVHVFRYQLVNGNWVRI